MEVTTYFENLKSIIVDNLLEAKSEVLIAVAWLNFKEYYNVFETLLDNNILLKIICSDNHQNRAHLLEIQNLCKKGAKIKLLTMPSTRNHMHHKFSIIDNKTIINGSFNWSPNATKSFENLLVIKDCPTEVIKFNQEFSKILNIEKHTIRNVQKRVKCNLEDDCDGELLNILVFSEKSSKYYETCGDIVKVCNSCYNFETIKSFIQNNQLYILINSLPNSSDDFEYEYMNKLIFEELNQYINNGSIIHAVGKVSSGLDYKDEDYLNTNIIWKNKFVGDRIPNIIEDQDFDVFYDN